MAADQESGLENPELIDDEEVEDQLIEAGAGTAPVESAEEAAIHTDTATAKEVSPEPESKKEKTVSRLKAAKTHKRSKRYLLAKKSIEDKIYSLEEGIDLAKKSANVKFDPAIEIHIRIEKSKGKIESVLRGVLTLPAGAAKTCRVLVLDEPAIEKIEKGFLDFDIALATPAMMPKAAKLAKILGPKGKMPTPKTGTVTEDVEKAKKEFAGGKIEYRSDSQNIVHLAVGRVSWPKDRVIANAEALLAVLPKNRIKSIFVNATMGPGVMIEIPE